MPRYIHAVLRISVILFVAAACGGRTPEATTVTGGGTHPVTQPAGQGSGTGSGSSAPKVAATTLPDVGCLTPSCAFHPGTATYFACLAGGAGACFHFGSPCEPTDGCMYDPADHVYKQCSRAVQGTCQQWGAACGPKSACMFDPADSLHHHCDQLAGGTCKKYGALCAP
jgi:hypothetical protein